MLIQRVLGLNHTPSQGVVPQRTQFWGSYERAYHLAYSVRTQHGKQIRFYVEPGLHATSGSGTPAPVMFWNPNLRPDGMTQRNQILQSDQLYMPSDL